jgi:putative ABC transport system ATP-binding protein
MIAESKEHTLARATELNLSSIREPAIRIRDLQHYYDEGQQRKQVLFNNCLDIAAGEIVIMTGPSGSGKTTLLTLIGTLRSVQEGSLNVLGHELLGASQSRLVEIRRELGFIFQAHNLFDSLTAMQNVRMGLELFSDSALQRKEKASQMLTRLGLGERLNYKPGSLSGGQRQRVAIARALVHRPKLVLADEPTAALDEASGREVVTLLKQLADEDGCTILMVTHDNRILDVADRIVNMVDGRIKSDVNVKESSVICEFLQNCDVFSQLTPQTLTEMADQMWSEEVPAGGTIIRQGDVGDKFYLIRRGAVKVDIDDGSTSRTVANLSAGAYFGESALLTGEPRSASVIATEDSVVYALGKEDFRNAIDASASFEEELRKALFNRQ